MKNKYANKLFSLLVPESDAKFAVDSMRSSGVSADDFDIYWRKCSQYRFKQMSESKSTADILNEWPEYLRPSGFQLVRFSIN